jgi:glycerate kinase
MPDSELAPWSEPPTGLRASERALGRSVSDVLIPDTPIVASTSFSPALPAPRVAGAIGRGLRAGGLLEAELFPLTTNGEEAPGLTNTLPAELRTLLDALDFDTRLHLARAVIIADGRLKRGTRGPSLIGSATFEIATRARQAGVPAYAIFAEKTLGSFDARMLDLQVVLQAGTARALTAAGRKLASLI